MARAAQACQVAKHDRHAHDGEPGTQRLPLLLLLIVSCHGLLITYQAHAHIGVDPYELPHLFVRAAQVQLNYRFY